MKKFSLIANGLFCLVAMPIAASVTCPTIETIKNQKLVDEKNTISWPYLTDFKLKYFKVAFYQEKHKQ